MRKLIKANMNNLKYRHLLNLVLAMDLGLQFLY